MRRTISLSSLVLFLTILPSTSALAKRAAGEETAAVSAPKRSPEPKPSRLAVKKVEPLKKAEPARQAEQTRAEPPKKAEPAKTQLAATKRTDKRAKKEAAPCFSPEVHLVRKRGDELETRDLHLTFCDGKPNPSALDSISVLARPRNVERPFMPEIKAYQRMPLDRGPDARRRRPDYLSERVMRVHPGLIVRLQRIAARFPGRTIEIISGHRPDARDTSRHHHGRALDVRVDGVKREVLRDFLRSFDETGVGYYPNGYFVHLDVRDDRGYWVDRGGPGEAADYGPWPPPGEEIQRVRTRVIENAVAELGQLADPSLPVEERDSPEPERARVDAPTLAVEQVPSAHEGDELTRDEVARIKAEALKALSNLEIAQDP